MEDPIATPDCQLLALEITQLSAQVNAASFRLLQMIEAFDAQGGWAGWTSCAHWLNWSCGWSLRTAREKLRVAKCLKDRPLIAKAFEAGEISFSKVRAMTRVATDATEEYLLDIARHGTASHLEKVVRYYRGVLRENALEHAQKQYNGRELDAYYEDDNTMVIRLKLPAAQGALVMNALEGLVDEEIAKKTVRERDGSAEPSEEEYKPTLAERRADAFVELAGQSLDKSNEKTSSPRYQVVVHVDQKVLQHGEVGLCELENGPELANETARRLSCDAHVINVVDDEFGEPVNIGRKHRSMPTGLARALRIRDQGCRFPGCTHKKHVEGHHIQHWSQGGETSLDNMIQLCHFHHRLVHEGQWHVKRVGPNQFEFSNPQGRVVSDCYRGQRADQHEVIDDITDNAIDTDNRTHWDGSHVDYCEMIRQLQVYEGVGVV
ncbi:MAG: DUF222 domain-containing protein [Pseudomonadota bacterium]